MAKKARIKNVDPPPEALPEGAEFWADVLAQYGTLDPAEVLELMNPESLQDED